MVGLRLFQEDLATEPFWMLVACQLVNQTPWVRSEKVFHALRRLWSTPEDLACADACQVYEVVRQLGLGRRRAGLVGKLARRWLSNPPTEAQDVLKFPGCGSYAADSWGIFVERDRSVIPSDRKLIEFLERS